MTSCSFFLSSDDVLKTDVDEEGVANNEVAAFEKKIRTKGKFQMTPKDQVNDFLPDDSCACPTRAAVSKDVKLKKPPEKEHAASDIMGIVKGISRRPSKGLSHQHPADKSSKEREHAAGLRVKKIMRRATEDKESSNVVQKLRKEIREAVRNKTSADIGDNLFDPKLLAAFRTAVAGPATEAVDKLPHSALKAKKSMLQKGKIRENLTKKIYGNSNGRRRRAWDRDCEVEFWKHRCMRATKPEKIATLKSVLNLLRRNTESLEMEQASEGRATNPILSRLYLADTSVFPRKDDIKPLSALAAASNTEQNRGQLISVEKGQNPSHDDCAQKVAEANKVNLKPAIPSVDKGLKVKFQSSKGKVASGEAHLDKAPHRPLQRSVGGSKVDSKKETTVQSDDKKMDKRKWALEVLARKKAGCTNTTHERMENNTVFKGNYPLLVCNFTKSLKPVILLSAIYSAN